MKHSRAAQAPHSLPIPPASVWLPPRQTQTAMHGELPCCEPWITSRIRAEFGTHGSEAKKTPARSGEHLIFLCDIHLQRDDLHGSATRIPQAARSLRPEGILAILTRNCEADQSFSARCGDLVAHARAHGLVYLQHIILVHEMPTTAMKTKSRALARSHRPIHSDLVVFTTIDKGNRRA